MSVTTFHDTNIIAILGMPGTTLPLPLPFYWRVLWEDGEEEKRDIGKTVDMTNRMQ